MSDNLQFKFSSFTLNPADKCLRRGANKTTLRPKSVALLRFFLERPNRLVGKQELITALWPRMRVVDAALKVSIAEIRKALGDRADQPKFIETVGRSGYRFIAPVRVELSAESAGNSTIPLIGRQRELERLHSRLTLANRGQRQLIFVTGEPGVGKTSLVEAFIESLPATDGFVTGHGQCIEQYGAGNASMPILDALERLCSAPGGRRLVDALRRNAPSWLINLSGLISPEERAELARQTAGATAQRRLREIAAFFQDIAKLQTVVLVIEDLHWVDPSTLALIDYLARRREAARLLVIGTYRETEVLQSNQPLAHVSAELESQKYSTHLPIRPLSQTAVAEYLAARFATNEVSKPVSAEVYRRSEGNPLFMVNVTDYLVGVGALVQENGAVILAQSSTREEAPESIRDLIERQISKLPPMDQELLATASVAGGTFSVAVIARVLDSPRQEIENRCQDLAARAQFLQTSGSRRRPNGRGTPRYSFMHALYQNVIYGRVDEAKRKRWHQAIGARTEAAYQGATDAVATELALHFELGGDYAQAVKYLLASAQIALGKCGYDEAIVHATKGLSLIGHLKKDAAVNDIELSFQLLLGVAYANSQGFAALEAKAAFSKAHEHSRRNDNDQLLFRTFFGLWLFHTVHADLPLARAFANDMVTVANRNNAVEFNMIASMSVGITDFYLGRFSAARQSLAKVVTLSNSQNAETAAAICGWNPLLGAGAYKAHSLWFLGFPDRALVEINKASECARQHATPYDQALTYALIATYFTYSSDPQTSLHWCDSALNIARESEFDHWTALATILKGTAKCRLGQIDQGMALIHEGVSLWKATGADKAKPVFYAFEAEAWLLAQDRAAARAAIDRGLALSQVTKDSYYDAELWRLKGEAASGITSKQE